MSDIIKLEKNDEILLNGKLYKLNKSFNASSYDSSGNKKDISNNDYQSVLERGYISFI
tara:strand:- start:184 stop:357 length:174 start_codon:yes stop_codon:yes gene_type:complete